MIYTKIPQMADTIMEVFKEASFSFSIYLSYISLVNTVDMEFSRESTLDMAAANKLASSSPTSPAGSPPMKRIITSLAFSKAAPPNCINNSAPRKINRK